MKEWYCAISGQPYGPLREEQLKEMIGRGEVTPGTLVWSGSTPEDAARGWVMASDTELAALLGEFGESAERAGVADSPGPQGAVQPDEPMPEPVEAVSAVEPERVPLSEPRAPLLTREEPARREAAPERATAGGAAPSPQAPAAERREASPGTSPAGKGTPTVPQTSSFTGQGHRIAAFMIDAVILLAFLLILKALPVFRYMGRAAGLTAGVMTALMALGLVASNLYLLHREGQSIGKKAMRVKIVALDGTPAPLWKITVLRGSVYCLALISAFGALYVNGYIGFLGVAIILLDGCFALRRDRRALHDLIAGTVVVKA